MEGEVKEKKFEILMGQLILVIVIGLIFAVFIGYQMGKETGQAIAVSHVTIEKPEYCTIDKQDDKIIMKCNELKNVTLDELCEWVSPELKEKVKIMLIP